MVEQKTESQAVARKDPKEKTFRKLFLFSTATVLYALVAAIFTREPVSAGALVLSALVLCAWILRERRAMKPIKPIKPNKQ